MTTIGDKIRDERRKQGFSQKRLSDGICSQSSLSRLENNNANISLTKVGKILQKLNVSLDELMETEEIIREKRFTDELDTARDARDYDGMERILSRDHPHGAGEKSKMYVKWHEGLVSFSKKDYEKSEAQLQHAIYIADKNKFRNYIPHLYMAMGNTKHYLKDQPFKYYAEADRTYRDLKIDDCRLRTKILYNQIVSHSKADEHYKVVLKCKKAIQILSIHFSTYLMCEIYDFWLKALKNLNEKESYTELHTRSHIIFEHHSRLDMWEKLENYPVVNN